MPASCNHCCALNASGSAICSRWQQGGKPPLQPEVAQKLQPIAETVDCRQLFDLLDKVADALNSLGSGLNRQLILEDLLIFWAKLSDLIPYRTKVAGR